MQSRLQMEAQPPSSTQSELARVLKEMNVVHTQEQGLFRDFKKVKK